MISFDLARDVPDDVDLVVEGVTIGSEPDDPVVRATGFEAKVGKTLLLPGRLLVGLGENGSSGPDDRSAAQRPRVPRRGAAAQCERIATTLPASQAVAEGFSLGAYRFTKYRSDPKPNRIRSVTVVGGGGQRGLAAARAGRADCRGRRGRARPGQRARRLADAAGLRRRHSSAGQASGLDVKVLTENAIAKAGIHGLLAVNRGSTSPPRWVELTYEPETPARMTVALVGKGITFDSGGLSIKPTDGMVGMKGDMGGAAAVAAAMSAARDVGVKVRVRAFLPLTDNMLGGDAQRVGDVIRTATARPSRCSTPTPKAG